MASQTALVTGASRGIGREIARQLATRGLRVAVHYKDQAAAAESVVETLPGRGHVAIAADLTDANEAQRLWSEATRHLGEIGVLVNNAAVYDEHPPLATDFESWRKAWERTLAANLLGPAHLSFLAANAMAERGVGRIVNVSSRGAFRGEPEAPAYGASKAGLNCLGQSLAKALAGRGVLVFGVAPGWVETDMAQAMLAGPRGAEIRGQHPLGRLNRSEEVARTVVFCALEAPEAMTGAILDVNGASYLRT